MRTITLLAAIGLLFGQTGEKKDDKKADKTGKVERWTGELSSSAPDGLVFHLPGDGEGRSSERFIRQLDDITQELLYLRARGSQMSSCASSGTISSLGPRR